MAGICLKCWMTTLGRTTLENFSRLTTPITAGLLCPPFSFTSALINKETKPMSTVLESPTQERESLQRNTVGEQLQSATTAIRLHVRWPGVRKTLSQGQRRLAAGAFSADVDVLSAGKKLFDTTHPVFRTVSAVKSKAVACWRGQTLRFNSTKGEMFGVLATAPGIHAAALERLAARAKIAVVR